MTSPAYTSIYLSTNRRADCFFFFFTTRWSCDSPLLELILKKIWFCSLSNHQFLWVWLQYSALAVGIKSSFHFFLLSSPSGSLGWNRDNTWAHNGATYMAHQHTTIFWSLRNHINRVRGSQGDDWALQKACVDWERDTWLYRVSLTMNAWEVAALQSVSFKLTQLYMG